MTALVFGLALDTPAVVSTTNRYTASVIKDDSTLQRATRAAKQHQRISGGVRTMLAVWL
jgi:hypothetical protein